MKLKLIIEFKVDLDIDEVNIETITEYLSEENIGMFIDNYTIINVKEE